MKRLVLIATLCACLGGTAHAACYADYKAKRDHPLRLQYGVMQIEGKCTRRHARHEIRTRLAQHHWTLLHVLSVFGQKGLNEQRKESAGPYFLRY